MNFRKMDSNTTETCATLKCPEKCCSHDYDRDIGGQDHCCTKEEYEAHIKGDLPYAALLPGQDKYVRNTFFCNFS